MISPALVSANGREREIAEALFEQRRSENLAYCRTLTCVYALHRAMYADGEADYLSRPADFGEIVAARRRLAAAEVALGAQVATLLRVGPAAALHAIEVAVGFVERIPKVFALVGEGVLSPKAGEVALTRSRVLDHEQVREFDDRLQERLTRDYEVLSIPALREEADLLVAGIDAEAAERRRKLAEQDRRVTFRPEDDGMAAAFALLPAHDARELSARIDHIAETACADDPRTLMQRRADGFMQLTRGYGTLGCQCSAADCRYRDARHAGEPEADGVVARFVTLINVVINERDLVPSSRDPQHDEPADGAFVDAAVRQRPESGYLVGHGPITGRHARELADRADARIRPFGERVDGAQQPAPATPPADRIDEPAHDRICPPPVSQWSAIDFKRAWSTIILNFDHPRGRGGGVDAGADDGDPAPDPDPGPRPGAGSEADSGPTTGPGSGPAARQPGDPPSGERRAQDRPADVPPADSPLLNGSGHTERRGDSSAPTAEPCRRALVRARGATGYRPSADLDRYVRLVFPRCVFPFCTRPASRAQLDHRREYDHRSPELGGRTTADEIQPLCIAHHQLKTAGEWIDARMPDGRILWTAPDGRSYLVDPSSIVLRLFPDLARVSWTVPEQRQSVPTPGGRTRLQREHARRDHLRRRNTAVMQDALNRRNTPRSIVEDDLATRLGSPIPLDRRYDGPPPF
ncbi:hypothetical protein GCM10027289_28560 [Tsukamurella serpentis]